jgi:hypothetical protein
MQNAQGVLYAGKRLNLLKQNTNKGFKEPNRVRDQRAPSPSNGRERMDCPADMWRAIVGRAVRESPLGIVRSGGTRGGGLREPRDSLSNPVGREMIQGSGGTRRAVKATTYTLRGDLPSCVTLNRRRRFNGRHEPSLTPISRTTATTTSCSGPGSGVGEKEITPNAALGRSRTLPITFHSRLFSPKPPLKHDALRRLPRPSPSLQLVWLLQFTVTGYASTARRRMSPSNTVRGIPPSFPALRSMSRGDDAAFAGHGAQERASGAGSRVVRYRMLSSVDKWE